MAWNISTLFTGVTVGVLTLMTLLWAIAQVRANANIVDVGWAAALGVVAVLLMVAPDLESPRRWLVGGLAAVWAFRLAGYLFLNRVVGKPEDGRYVALRVRLGSRAGLGFLLFFWAQGLLVLIFAVPFWIAMTSSRPMYDGWDIAGLIVWTASVLGEWLADAQLAAFRADPTTRGQVCRRGLWRYSRHPNYFFEWLHWWTYPLLAVGAAWWPATLIGPALMAFFLFRVTGIPATEAHALRSRGDDYGRYQRTTSAFFPWFPRKDAE